MIFLQSTEETAEENSLQILKRKNNRHKGETHFDARRVNSVFTVSVKLSRETRHANTAPPARTVGRQEEDMWLKNAVIDGTKDLLSGNLGWDL